MQDFKDLNRIERVEALKGLGEPAFREKQIFEWICKAVRSFDDMKNLSKELRAKLSENFSFETLDVAMYQESKTDGTRKYLLGLSGGNKIEAVFMKYDYGNALCISTQVGCAMGCKFCASTLGGKARDLKAWEMLDEYLVVQNHVGEPINHIVLMGIGEPFDNYENVKEFLTQVHDPKGANLSYRNITISTCGLVPKILEFAKDFPQVTLAISLHAAKQEEREQLMPIAKRYNLQELLSACKEYTEITGRRITFEYTLISGKNDSLDNAKDLAKLLKGLNCHVNLITLNPVAETGLLPADRKRAEEYRDFLEENGIAASIRRKLGSDIDAACGQLRKKNL